MVRRRPHHGIRLSFEITSPLGPDDKDLLTRISIMTLAIANHELAKEHFPGVFPDDEDGDEQARQDQQRPLPCMVEHEGQHCIGEVGHDGRHTYRRILPPADGLN
jgi:hypothetical protein